MNFLICCLSSNSKISNFVNLQILSNTFTSFDSKAAFLFIKELTATCISMVLYLRNIFPELYFESQNFEGMSLKILKEGNKQSLAGRIHECLEGAFEAIEKKYIIFKLFTYPNFTVTNSLCFKLKHLILDIQDAETNMTLEIYTMSFNYKQGNETLNFIRSTSQSNKNCGFTESNTKLNVINLLQMCAAVTRNSSDPPLKITLAVRLAYHENTPEDYQPRGYKALEQKPDTAFPNQTRRIEIGVIETPYHYFKFINKSCLNEKFCKASSSCYKHEFKERMSQIVPKKQIATERISKTSPTSGFRSRKVSCVCLSTERSETVISCLACKNLAHAECFGLLQPQIIKKIKFYCHLCHQPQADIKCPDIVLMNLENPSDQQKLAVMRKVLKFCTKNYNTKITLWQMKKIAGSACRTNAVKIILKKMIEKEIVVPQTNRKTYLIDKNELTNKIVHYFY